MRPPLETARRDALVAVVKKHRLLLPGHRQHQVKGAQQKGTALCAFPAQEPSGLLSPSPHGLLATHESPAHSHARSESPRTQHPRRTDAVPLRCRATGTLHTQGNLPPLVAQAGQTGFPGASPEQRGCLTRPSLPPAPAHCSTIQAPAPDPPAPRRLLACAASPL